MSEQYIPIVIVIAALIGTVAIGIWAGRRNKVRDDWLVAGRRLGLAVFSAAFIATMVSGFGAVGAPGLLYAFGWGPWVALTAIVVSTPITFILIAKPLWVISKRYDAPSIPHVLQIVYGSRTLRTMASIIIALLLMAYMVVQWSAAARLGEGLLGLPYFQSLILFVLVVGFYSALGGSMADSYTDFFQAIVMVVGVVAVTVAGLSAVGGFTAMNTTIGASEPQLLQLWNDDFRPELLFSLLIIFGLVQGGDIRTASRILFVKDAKTFRWAPLVAGLLYVVVSSMIWLVGLYVRALSTQGTIPTPESPDQVMFVFLNNVVSPVIAGIVYAAIVAAILSTIDSVLVLTSSAFVHDLARETLGVRLDERRELRALRWMTVVVVALTVAASIRPPEFIGLLAADVIGVFCASFFAVLVLGLRWRRSTAAGAIAAMAVGFVSGLVFVIGETALGWQIPVISGAAWPVVASIIVMVAVSLATRDAQAPASVDVLRAHAPAGGS